MTTHVALLGPLPVAAQETLEELVTLPTSFSAVQDLSDITAVQEILSRADVVVGDLPSDIPPAPNVKLVQQKGAGVENYDLTTFPENAFLCNVYHHGPAIAEFVFVGWSMLRRRIPTYDQHLREGRWPVRDPNGEVPDLRDTSLGLIGYGHIGKAIASMAQAFQVSVRAIRRTQENTDPPDQLSFLGGPDDLGQILTADAVVAACPLTEETRSLISSEELRQMPESSILINVARGPIVDEQPLYNALATGDIRGAVIDTWYNYPTSTETCRPSSFPFETLDNVLLTPHIMGWTDGTASRRWAFIAENIDRITRGDRPKNVVRAPGQDE